MAGFSISGPLYFVRRAAKGPRQRLVYSSMPDGLLTGNLEPRHIVLIRKLEPEFLDVAVHWLDMLQLQVDPSLIAPGESLAFWSEGCGRLRFRCRDALGTAELRLRSVIIVSSSASYRCPDTCVEQVVGAAGRRAFGGIATDAL